VLHHSIERVKLIIYIRKLKNFRKLWQTYYFMYSVPIYQYVKPKRFQDKRLLRVYRLGQAELAGNGICPPSKKTVGMRPVIPVIRLEESAQRSAFDKIQEDLPIPKLKRAFSPGLTPFLPYAAPARRKPQFGDVRAPNVQIIRDKTGRPIHLCRQFKMVRSFQDFFNLFTTVH